MIFDRDNRPVPKYNSIQVFLLTVKGNFIYFNQHENFKYDNVENGGIFNSVDLGRCLYSF